MFYQNTWKKTAAVILFLVIFAFFLYLNVTNDSSKYLVKILSAKSFPFKLVLLEGLPGLSQPERKYISEVKSSVVGLGTYLLTGVNISDARTYFLSFYALPADGPSWLGWAYYPNDPEMEGTILEPLNNPFHSEPAPITSQHDVLVAVYHTHTAESYAGDGGEERVAGGKKGEVVEAGQILVDELNKKGINTIHSSVVNDQDFNKSYDHSYLTAKKILEENPTIRLLLDVHRDGLPPQAGKNTVKIKGKESATVMVVIGQKNPNWEENNKIAEQMIKIGEVKYPGLLSTKITYASDARYNQSLTNGAILLEIGSQLNTAEEAKAAAALLAEVLKEYLNSSQ